MDKKCLKAAHSSKSLPVFAILKNFTQYNLQPREAFMTLDSMLFARPKVKFLCINFRLSVSLGRTRSKPEPVCDRSHGALEDEGN